MPVQGDEDWDLWLTLVKSGHCGIIIPDVLFEYRRRAGSLSTTCWHGAGHLPLARYRIAKHADAYGTHVRDVLLRQDADTAALLRRNDQLERYIASDLEPSIVLRREELAVLRSRLASALVSAPPAAVSDPQRIQELEAALHATCTEVAALRNSASWRITSPLRHAYEWWLNRRAAS